MTEKTPAIRSIERTFRKLVQEGYDKFLPELTDIYEKLTQATIPENKVVDKVSIRDIMLSVIICVSDEHIFR